MAKLDDILAVLEKQLAIQEADAKAQAAAASAAKQPKPKPTLADRINEGASYARKTGGSIGSRDFSGASSWLSSLSKWAGSFTSDKSMAGMSGGAGQAAGAAASGGSGAGGALAATLAIPGVGEAVAVVAGAAALATAFAGLTKAVVDTATSFLESQRHFADSSGAMAQVFAKLDLFNVQRDQLMGEAIAPSAGDLEESLEELMDTLTPYISAMYIAVNEILSFIVDVFSGLIQMIEDMALGVGKVVDWLFDSHLEEGAKKWLAMNRVNDKGSSNAADFFLFNRKKPIGPPAV